MKMKVSEGKIANKQPVGTVEIVPMQLFRRKIGEDSRFLRQVDLHVISSSTILRMVPLYRCGSVTPRLWIPPASIHHRGAASLPAGEGKYLPSTCGRST